MEEMNQQQLIQRNIEEFSRLQTYMTLVEKTSNAYEAMKTRYLELKVILTSSGINLTTIDIINE